MSKNLEYSLTDIPQQWQFNKENFDPDTDFIRTVDRDAGYLKIEKHGCRAIIVWESFYGPTGLAIAQREARYAIGSWLKSSNPWFVDVCLLEDDQYYNYYFSEPGNLNVRILFKHWGGQSFHDRVEHFGSVDYANNQANFGGYISVLGPIFDVNFEGKVTYSPRLTIGSSPVYRSLAQNIAYMSEGVLRDESYQVEEGEKPNWCYIRHKESRDPLFKVQQREVEREVRKGEFEPFIELEQLHLPTQKAKILGYPTTPNVAEAVSLFFCPTRLQGEPDWRDVNKIVPFDLSYSVALRDIRRV